MASSSRSTATCTIRIAAIIASLLPPLVALAQQIPAPLADFARSGIHQKSALKVNDAIYQATGFSNTFLVLTGAGNIIIDSSSATTAGKHHELLSKVSDAPIQYIILTHGHNDHTGGVKVWRGPDTKLVVQRNFVEFRRYQDRLGKYFARTNAAQFGLEERELNAFHQAADNQIDPDLLFDDHHVLELGDARLELYHTPGETPDHLSVWIPKYKAAFVGDNFYGSFPNIYTLRGTQPRWALDYVASLNKILSLEPEIVLPSHGAPIVGNDKIRERLTRYRNAIQYVHDATVQGMNDGKDVFTLMREIKLPAELDIGEFYGKVSWSVRGIYEGYVGWFDQNPAMMYDRPPNFAAADLVGLAGGAEPVAKRARDALGTGDPLRALHLADAAIVGDANCQTALEVKIEALRALQKQSRNMIEHAWLATGIRKTEQALKKLTGNDASAANSATSGQ